MIFSGPARGINTKCYHQPCDSKAQNETVPFANMEFLSLITQTMIDTLVDATEATCAASNRTVPRFQAKKAYGNSGQYILYDKVNGKPIVGLDPFRTTDSNKNKDDVPRNVKKRSPLAEKEYFDPHQYLKYVQSSSRQPSSDQNAETISSFSPSTRIFKDSDPKSYVPPKQSSKKNMDPKTSAQNNLSLRYQSTIPKQSHVSWHNSPPISNTPIIQTSPALRILPTYNTWPSTVVNHRQPLFHGNTIPYLAYPVYAPPRMRAAPISRTNFCYPFCNFDYFYSIHG